MGVVLTGVVFAWMGGGSDVLRQGSGSCLTGDGSVSYIAAWGTWQGHGCTLTCGGSIGGLRSRANDAGVVRARGWLVMGVGSVMKFVRSGVMWAGIARTRFMQTGSAFCRSRHGRSVFEGGGWLSACESDIFSDGLIKNLCSGAGDVAVARIQGRLIMVIGFVMGVVCSGVM